MNYRAFLTGLAKESALIMHRYHRPGETIPSDEKAGKNGPVTAADLAISKVVQRRVKQAFPDAMLSTEESSYARYKGKGRHVVSDEIDGTYNFANGGDQAVHATAIIVDGDVVAAVIYAPLLAEPRLFYAERGRGATVNGTPIRVSKRKKNLRIVVGVTPDGNPNELFAGEPLKEALIAAGHTVLPMDSSMHCCGALAAGEVDAVVFAFPTSHDAIGDLAVRLAGGTTSDLKGDRLDISKPTIYGYVMANRQSTQQMLVEAVAPYLRKGQAHK